MILSGIRVLDFSQYIPGPYGSLRLANLGAEVIHIEPLTGDLSRGVNSDINEMKFIFHANNYGKKSMTINIKDVAGKELIQSLVKVSDVVIEGFRPGVMEKLGLDYKRIRELKEDVIYLSLSGYGQDGPLALLGSHDLNYMSISGVLSQMKNEFGRPILPTITFADFLGGVMTSESILAALLHKEKTGLGQYIDLALADTVHDFMGTHTVIERETGQKHGIPFLSGTILSYNIYQTKEGRYVSLAALEPKFWQNFCDAVEHKEWINANYSMANEGNPIYLELKELFKSRSLEEWTTFGLVTDCCLTPILEVDELEKHPYFMNKEHFFASKEKSPGLGEHNEYILEKILGKSQEEIVKLRREQVISHSG